MELREVLYLLLLVYYKGYKSGTARWERCTGLSRLHPLGSGIRVFTSWDALQTPRFRDFYGDAVTQASLIKPLAMDD